MTATNKHGFISDDGKVSVRVRWEEDWEEFAIQWFESGVYNEDKTGYTDDWDDAISTAKMTIKRYNELGN